MKYFLVAIFSSVLLVGCLKNDDPAPCTAKTLQSEMPTMTKYATDSSITTTADPSGLLYQIVEPGTGATPSVQSKITVNYSGRRMDGVEFDKSFTGDQSFVLNSVIDAWKIALPKIKEGGKIKFITPSVLAYSCNPFVPTALNNQPLYFYVELLSVQ